MEKKKNIWMGKIVVIVLIIVSIGSYYVFPSVKHVIFAYDFSVDCSATSGISDYICKCESFWMVAGSYSVMEQCDGRSSGMLFHCKNTWT